MCIILVKDDSECAKMICSAATVRHCYVFNLYTEDSYEHIIINLGFRMFVHKCSSLHTLSEGDDSLAMCQELIFEPCY
jgi:hypothetical protein